MSEPDVNWDDKPFSTKANKPTVGADPEMFVKSGNKLLPAFQFLPEKEKGIPVYHKGWSKGEVSNLYWDGFQAEWRHPVGNICLVVFTMLQQASLRALLKAARKFDDKARLTLESVVKIPQDILASENDQYIALGCLPSMNAYDDSGIHVDNPRELPFRFAGGHIHFGHNDDTRELSETKMNTIVKNLDSVLAVWAVGAAQSFDNPVRRRYYGKAGEYRKPVYLSKSVGEKEIKTQGTEYRTLSNFHLSSPYVFNMVYEIGRLVYQLSWSRAFELWASDEFETRTAVNECDVKMARDILKRNKEMFKWLLRHKGTLNKETIDLIYNTGINGIESVIKDPEDIEKNWELSTPSNWGYTEFHESCTLTGGIYTRLKKAQ